MEQEGYSAPQGSSGFWGTMAPPAEGPPSLAQAESSLQKLEERNPEMITGKPQPTVAGLWLPGT